ncbi:hypothetical protein [Oscillatoria sp. HE19RPO]|uniref:hypothetical protein n=1 Tax=Oscillatoria sp. HE19RPO TaxID=2954806 RepID=UPI0020C2C88F|nr:hypothetical protein [Oscillatoria sp. HE19RPO]
MARQLTQLGCFTGASYSVRSDYRSTSPHLIEAIASIKLGDRWPNFSPVWFTI